MLVIQEEKNLMRLLKIIEILMMKMLILIILKCLLHLKDQSIIRQQKETKWANGANQQTY